MSILISSNDFSFKPRTGDTYQSAKVRDLNVGDKVLMDGERSKYFTAPPRAHTIESINRKFGFTILVFTSLYIMIIPSFVYVRVPKK